MALAIDGSIGFTGTTNPITCVLTTTQSNDIIIVSVAPNGVTVSSITGGGLSFTQRAESAASGNAEYEWSAVAASPLSAVTLTINFSAAPSACTGCAFGISGANTSTIWDSNGSIPATGVAAADPTFSTTNANDIVIGSIRGNTATPTAGSGWTAIYAPTNGFYICQYQIFSSPQSGTTCALGTGSGNGNGYIVDAIIQGSSVSAAVADGHTASGTTVATGTGGASLGAVTIANGIDVLFRASSATAHTCTCADQLGNNYNQIDHNDSTATHSLEWYRFACGSVTVPGTPVITCTYGASAQLDIAASAMSGLIAVPFAASVNHYQSAASIGGSPAVDSQNSTNLPTLSSKPTLLTCWGYCDANGTPVYGTQFTGVGTAWSTLGSGTPRLAYENLTYNSFVPISGRFTPVPSQDAYTFFAAFNEPALPVTPAGSMPKQIYVMP